MMQDGKALQGGTSHYLGQNFAKAFNIEFTDKNGKKEHTHTTSWGVTTRLIGAMAMIHSDDDGLITPPRISPSQIVILPTYRNDEEKETVNIYIETICKILSEKEHLMVKK